MSQLKSADILTWESNIAFAIKDMSDLEFQKTVWMGLDPKNVSSFGEILCVLYDDLCFDDYLEYLETNFGQDKLYLLMKELDNMVSAYKPNLQDWQILRDPLWLMITEKAKEVIEEMRIRNIGQL